MSSKPCSKDRPSHEDESCREKVVAFLMPLSKYLRHEASVRKWRLLNLNLYNGIYPNNITIDGLLTTLLPDEPAVKEFRENGYACPAVRIGQLAHPLDDTMPAIIFNPYAEGQLAADHFAERWFRQVAMVCKGPWRDHQERFAGFSARCEELGITCFSERLIGRQGESKEVRKERERKQLLAFIKDQPKPMGLFIPTPAPAALISSWLLNAGIDVPSDVAILTRGMGEKPTCLYSMPSISYIDLNDKGRTQAACEMLDRMMNGEDVPQQTIAFKPDEVVELESTRVLAVDDPVVAIAVKFIWNNLRVDFEVSDVASEAGVSLRQLERRFSQAIGRSVVKELRRKRLEVFKGLLLESDEPIAEIGKRAGFQSPNYLFKNFRKTFGMSPKEYRDLHS